MSLVDAADRLAAAVLAAFPDPDTAPVVTGYPGPTDPPVRGTVVIGVSAIDPPSIACPTGRLYTFRVWAASAVTAPGAGDEDVDRLVESVLDGLDADRLVWSDVTRGVWQDAYPAYVLTVEVPQ